MRAPVLQRANSGVPPLMAARGHGRQREMALQWSSPHAAPPQASVQRAPAVQRQLHLLDKRWHWELVVLDEQSFLEMIGEGARRDFAMGTDFIRYL
jgi:hypothetical protein